MTLDSVSGTATDIAGAAGAGAKDNLDLYDRIRCTRNIDGASIFNCTRWKFVSAWHACSKRQSSNSLLVDLARDSILLQPLDTCFRVGRWVVGFASKVRARILFQGRRSVRFLEIRTCTRVNVRKQKYILYKCIQQCI